MIVRVKGISLDNFNFANLRPSEGCSGENGEISDSRGCPHSRLIVGNVGHVFKSNESAGSSDTS